MFADYAAGENSANMDTDGGRSLTGACSLLVFALSGVSGDEGFFFFAGVSCGWQPERDYFASWIKIDYFASWIKLFH